MSGNFIISRMFPRPNNANEKRMTELSNYAYGMFGWFYPFVKWVEWYQSKQETSHQSMTTAFILNSFIFGVAVLVAGMFRKLAGNAK